MRRYLCASLLVLVCCFSTHAQDVRFPASSPEPTAASAQLGGSALYVIDSDVPLLVLVSPQGLVVITKEEGPLRIRSRFVDSAKIETRTYKGKFIWIVEAAGTGAVELIVVKGLDEKTVVRKTLDVDGSPSPKPDPPKPADPPKKAIAHLTFIGATQATVAVINDKGLRDYCKANGIKVHVYASRDDPDLAAKGLKKYVDKTALPLMVSQGADGSVVDWVWLTTVADAYKFLKETP